MTIRTVLLTALGTAALALAPTEAAAQNVVANFRAEYTHVYPGPNPFLIGPYRVQFTLYDDGTWTNDDGNGGEWQQSGNNVTFGFFSQAEATAAYPPFGAATWTGVRNGNTVCNGGIRSPGIDPSTGYPTTVLGNWHTRGCP